MPHPLSPCKKRFPGREKGRQAVIFRLADHRDKALAANDPQEVPHILAEYGALKNRGGGRAPTRTSRQWRFVPRQATFGQLYTKGCRVYAFYRRHGHQGGLRGGKH
jgi:hypothetical protein